LEELSRLIELLSRGNEMERLRAAEELGDHTSSEAVLSLISCLQNDESRVVREACVASLCRIGTEEVAEEVAKLLGSSDPYVRNAASEILQLLGDRARHVVELLLRDPDPDVRALAVRSVGDGQFSNASALLRSVVLSDSDANVVASAVEYLGEIGGSEDDRDALRQVRARFSDPFLEYAVETALRKMGE
jgi:HEAT repeat protein